MTRIRTHKHINTGIANGDGGVFMCVVDNRTVDTKRGWFNTTTTRGKGMKVHST